MYRLVFVALLMLGLASPSFAQDFPLFFTNYGGGGVNEMSEDGTVTPRAAFPADPINSVREDTDGNLYACHERSPDVFRIDPAGTITVYATVTGTGCFGLLFGPDGSLFVTWHLDELFVNIQGRQQYLWRAVDQDGE